MADLYSKIIFEDLILPSFLHPEAADLLQKLLTRTASERPSVEEVLEHPWLAIRKVFSKDFDELEWDVEYHLAKSEALGSIVTTVLGSAEAQAMFCVQDEDEIREQLVTDPDSKLKP